MEFIELSQAENIYGRKQLIQAEISLLQAIKSAREYSRLKNEENQLKAQIRQKLILCSENLKNLESILPKVKQEKDKTQEPAIKVFKTRRDLELEINTLKDKLSLLSS